MLLNTVLALVHNRDERTSQAQRLVTGGAQGRGHTGTLSFLLSFSVNLNLL